MQSLLFLACVGFASAQTGLGESLRMFKFHFAAKIGFDCLDFNLKFEETAQCIQLVFFQRTVRRSG